MSRVFGEAHLDRTMQRYYYQIEADSGQVLARSDPVFASLAEAEAELIAALQVMAERSHKRVITAGGLRACDPPVGGSAKVR